MKTHRPAAGIGGPHPTIQAAYSAADELYRQTARMVQNAGAHATQSRQQSQQMNCANQLMAGCTLHRHVAAAAVTAIGAATAAPQTEMQYEARCHIRMCRQLALRTLMTLAQYAPRSPARRLLDTVLPVQRGDLITVRADDGNLDALGTGTEFGSHQAHHLGPRPRATALADLATNVLIERTRDWPFTKAHRQAFIIEFLERTQPGVVIEEDEIIAWINRERAGAVSSLPALAAV